MKTYTQTVREGELLGPIDWSYDFRSHYNSMGCDDARRDEHCRKDVEMLREVVRRHEAGESLSVNTSGYWHPLIAVGMYDGWPYWRPTPALLISGVLGSEWHFFDSLQGVRSS